MSTTEARTTDVKADADAGEAGETGARPHKVVDPMGATGRMTVETPEGDERTVVGCLDGLVAGRLDGKAPGSTVRMELSPAADGGGYVAARVRPGGLPAL
ncbi:hypothetical protein HZS55_06985 [Halosimplex rubrum]|uniref:Uncharacterized protein n=1 Tax=Halosimplex rubrum TaxID=869889 RepID=A0A7D5TN35_9EURY|nr:hypothetical protein [Halosimplex rubrum]QLH77054.1 hypothetical protein HZS55_06985 [Halosimplex rubrum]